MINNEFKVITKPTKYKVIQYKENDKRSLPILMSELGEQLIVYEDSIMFRRPDNTYALIEDGNYILIPFDEFKERFICLDHAPIDIKVYSDLNHIKENFYILSD